MQHANCFVALTEQNLINAWRKLWPVKEDQKEIEVSNNESENEQIINEITSLYKWIPGFEECEEGDTWEWVASDKDATELNDEEIVNMAKSAGAAEYDVNLSLIHI